jgi:uncharacterized protein YndB with AHSA1/START domain
MTFDPKLDLRLERTIDVPPSKVFACWTRNEHLLHWFVPKPWSLASADVEARPGGKFNFVMRSPEGQEMPQQGCMLEVVPVRRLVWSNCLTAGFRPATPDWGFTGVLTFEPSGPGPNGGTHYVAVAHHANEETRKKHEGMGFEQGWNAALDQLIAYSKTMK